MKAGRELDALIAEKVMGLDGPQYPDCPTCGSANYCRETPYLPYSTEIAAAWEVVEKLKTPDVYLEVLSHKGEPHWVCRIIGGKDPIGAGAETAPHAICLAALKAVSP